MVLGQQGGIFHRLQRLVCYNGFKTYKGFHLLCHSSCKTGLSLSHSLTEFFCIISFHVPIHRLKFSEALITNEFGNPKGLSPGERKMHKQTLRYQALVLKHRNRLITFTGSVKKGKLLQFRT